MESLIEKIRMVGKNVVVVCAEKEAIEKEIRVSGSEQLAESSLRCYICSGFNTKCSAYLPDVRIKI